MTRFMALCLALAVLTLPLPTSAGNLKATSERTVGDFAFPGSVAYDPAEKVLYVSEFVSALEPTEQDGKGRISKVSLDGKVLERDFLPAAGDTLNKPKGIWVKDGRLWATDIDSIWVFDLETRKGRKIELPGIKFASDATIVGDTLYVSDSRGDQLFRVAPADFLDPRIEPRISTLFSGKGVNPNGLSPGADDALLMVGFGPKDMPRGIYTIRMARDSAPSQPGLCWLDCEPIPMATGIGRLDGLYEMADGALLVTDWNAGSLFSWTSKDGMKPLAKRFKGPADFAVIPREGGLTVVVPDLVKSELRFVELRR